MTVKIIVITPERIVWNTTADTVGLPGVTGKVGILTNHRPLITAIDVGVLTLKLGDTKKALILFGGFAQVEDNAITVLVNDVEEIKEIDLPTATMAVTIATEQVEQTQTVKEKIQALQNLKKVTARAQAMTFL
jgi:F-type H+-transporting ATPase subunit epsilon|mmetsp:Transcript_44814/g.76192  ORF Transcript_44814/g.76192 Transcript_44814/m.76192 type:complete len:133 (-) Transcript_44814:50-448(-)